MAQPICPYSAHNPISVSSIVLPELVLSQWMLLTVVTLVAGTVQAATGFGFAVISVPFFLIVLDSLSAIQINILLNLFNIMVVAPSVWRLAPKPLLRGLTLGTLLGLPVGMLAYLYTDIVHAKVAVAILIIGFTFHLLISARRKFSTQAPGVKGSLFTGAISGALTSALAMPGPPVLIYLSHFNLKKEPFRTVNLSLYAISYTCALGLQATVGHMSPATWILSFVLMPIAALGGVIGHWISPWLSQQLFKTTVFATLILTGFYMLYSTLL